MVSLITEISRDSDLLADWVPRKLVLSDVPRVVVDSADEVVAVVPPFHVVGQDGAAVGAGIGQGVGGFARENLAAAEDGVVVRVGGESDVGCYEAGWVWRLSTESGCWLGLAVGDGIGVGMREGKGWGNEGGEQEQEQEQ